MFSHDSERDGTPFLQIIHDIVCKQANLPFDTVLFTSDILSDVKGERPGTSFRVLDAVID